MARVTKRDWQRIKLEYVTGETTLRALARKHGIAVSTLLRHFDREGWLAEREQYRDNIAQATRKRAAEEEINARVAAIRTARDIVTRWSRNSDTPSASEVLRALELWLTLEGETLVRAEVRGAFAQAVVNFFEDNRAEPQITSDTVQVREERG
jgi:AcrR family transcriptional regulator